MPDKWQALQQFWENFSLPVYDENTVPDEAEMPYITYEAKTGEVNHPVYVSAALHYFSQSWAEISQKSDEISQYIGHKGVSVKIDGGYMRVQHADPIAQRFPDDSAGKARKIVLNISCEFVTAE